MKFIAIFVLIYFLTLFVCQHRVRDMCWELGSQDFQVDFYKKNIQDFTAEHFFSARKATLNPTRHIIAFKSLSMLNVDITLSREPYIAKIGDS